MRRSFFGLALIFAFVFGAATGDFRDALSAGEAEEDVAAEERDQELLRSRAESNRHRKKASPPISRRLRSGTERFLAASPSPSLRFPFMPAIAGNQRQPLLGVFRI